MENWTPAEWTTFFVAAGGFVTLIATQVTGVIISIQNGKKADINSQKLDATKAKVDEVHEATNGKMAELLAVTATSNFAAGQKSEVDKSTGNKGA